ncbi:MAG TPA: DUF5615 family PIN-like protein [Phycisphaerae bacterium]|nr:DUF5615 family PIN-like protein [Phycisphaerae bacterium]HUT58849.1 DUF5615 family PIN-like protein [Phycisphaerae bacterium]
MRFLLDQDVYESTRQFLVEEGHDVLTVSQCGLATAEDRRILEEAQRQQRILVTRDRDFGQLVYLKRMATGVIYVRTGGSTLTHVHTQLGEVLQQHSERALRGAFVVVEPGRYRFRRLYP